jgi:hypothetical protein
MSSSVHFEHALKSTVVRETCALAEMFRMAVLKLDDLPAEALEPLHTRLVYMWRDRTGPAADLNHAITRYVEWRMRETRRDERRLEHGITAE